MKLFYLINLASGEVEHEGSKGKLRRIQKKSDNPQSYKVSKFKDALPIQSSNIIQSSSSIPEELKKRTRFKGRLFRRKIIRKRIARPETEEDLRILMRAGIGIGCKRRQNKKGEEIAVDLYFTEMPEMDKRIWEKKEIKRAFSFYKRQRHQGYTKIDALNLVKNNYTAWIKQELIQSYDIQ